jgi:hypothetical protein
MAHAQLKESLVRHRRPQPGDLAPAELFQASDVVGSVGPQSPPFLLEPAAVTPPDLPSYVPADQGHPGPGVDRRSGGRPGSLRGIRAAVVTSCAVAGIALGTGLHQAFPLDPAAVDRPKAPGTAHQQAAQAAALNVVMSSAAANRAAVMDAVFAVNRCEEVAQARDVLASAAQARAQLVAMLPALKVDQLADGTDLVQALRTGWDASRQADEHYAAWAAASIATCRHSHQPAVDAEQSAAGAASKRATIAKQRAAHLWTLIAASQQLPLRSPDQL